MKNGKTFEGWCDEYNFKNILYRWDDELNDRNPDEILYSSSYMAYIKCPMGIHPSEIKSINNFTAGHPGTMDCDMCNSLGYLFPDSIDFWSEENEKSPFYYDKKSNDIVNHFVQINSVPKLIFILISPDKFTK